MREVGTTRGITTLIFFFHGNRNSENPFLYKQVLEFLASIHLIHPCFNYLCVRCKERQRPVEELRRMGKRRERCTYFHEVNFHVWLSPPCTLIIQSLLLPLISLSLSLSQFHWLIVKTVFLSFKKWIASYSPSPQKNP